MSLNELLKAAKRKVDDGQVFSVVPSLDKHMAKMRLVPRYTTKEPAWYPSSLVSKDFCVRAGVLGRRYGFDYDPLEKTSEFERLLDIGTWMHSGWQDRYLGPMGILWGRWKCSRCFAVVEGFMPTDSCPKCQWVQNHSEVDLTPQVCVEECAFASPINRNDDMVEKHGGCIQCRKWGFWEHVETPVLLPEYGIRGRIDGLLALDPERKHPEVVWDLKSCATERFGPISAVGPGERDIKQITIYMHGLEKENAILTYANKNNGKAVDHHVKYDEAVIRQELDDAELMNKCLEVGDTPLRLRKCKTPDSPRASKCAACEACFKEPA